MHLKASQPLTKPQNNVFRRIAERQAGGLVTTTGNLANDCGNSRAYIYRVVKSLCEIGLVARYSHKYYRIKESK